MGEPVAPMRPPLNAFENIPDGWRVLWCPGCLYAVTWADEDAETYSQPEWFELRRAAATHECSASSSRAESAVSSHE